MLKIIAVIVWALVLFVLTCTWNLGLLLHQGMLLFDWVPHPDFADLAIVEDTEFINPHYLFQKVGHFVGFGFLAILLMSITRNRKKAFFLAFLYAVLTEILQLYFARDGRFLDMGIDSLGILLALYIYDK